MPAPIRWGVLGAAKIAADEVAPVIARSDGARLWAVASRDGDRAAGFAARFGAPRSYGDYADLLADPEIEAVYIALPNSLHREWTVAALGAGKHVLCEKPLGVNEAEVRDIREASRLHQRTVREGMMWRFAPFVARVHEILDSGEIGTVSLVRATFGVRNPGIDDPGVAGRNHRFSESLGGGALADLGCYCVDAIHEFIDGAPASVRSHLRRATGGVDTTVTAELAFGNGTLGQVFASMETPRGGLIEISGSAGWLTVSSAFRHRPADGPVTITVGAAGRQRTEQLPYVNRYQAQLAAFHAGLTTPETSEPSLDRTQATVRTSDAIRASWVNA